MIAIIINLIQLVNGYDDNVIKKQPLNLAQVLILQLCMGSTVLELILIVCVRNFQLSVFDLTQRCQNFLEKITQTWPVFHHTSATSLIVM